jgi:hypothetical protein
MDKNIELTMTYKLYLIFCPLKQQSRDMTIKIWDRLICNHVQPKFLSCNVKQVLV